MGKSSTKEQKRGRDQQKDKNGKRKLDREIIAWML